MEKIGFSTKNEYIFRTNKKQSFDIPSLSTFMSASSVSALTCGKWMCECQEGGLCPNAPVVDFPSAEAANVGDAGALVVPAAPTTTVEETTGATQAGTSKPQGKGKSVGGRRSGANQDGPKPSSPRKPQGVWNEKKSVSAVVVATRNAATDAEKAATAASAVALQLSAKAEPTADTLVYDLMGVNQDERRELIKKAADARDVANRLAREANAAKKKATNVAALEKLAATRGAGDTPATPSSGRPGGSRPGKSESHGNRSHGGNRNQSGPSHPRSRVEKKEGCDAPRAGSSQKGPAPCHNGSTCFALKGGFCSFYHTDAEKAYAASHPVAVEVPKVCEKGTKENCDRYMADYAGVHVCKKKHTDTLDGVPEKYLVPNTWKSVHDARKEAQVMEGKVVEAKAAEAESKAAEVKAKAAEEEAKAAEAEAKRIADEARNCAADANRLVDALGHRLACAEGVLAQAGLLQPVMTSCWYCKKGLCRDHRY